MPHFSMGEKRENCGNELILREIGRNLTYGLTRWVASRLLFLSAYINDTFSGRLTMQPNTTSFGNLIAKLPREPIWDKS